LDNLGKESRENLQAGLTSHQFVMILSVPSLDTLEFLVALRLFLDLLQVIREEEVNLKCTNIQQSTPTGGYNILIPAPKG
jgi:hypothetical protein